MPLLEHEANHSQLLGTAWSSPVLSHLGWKGKHILVMVLCFLKKPGLQNSHSRCLLHESEDPSSIPETHIKIEGELGCPLWMYLKTATVYLHIIIINKSLKKEKKKKVATTKCTWKFLFLCMYACMWVPMEAKDVDLWIWSYRLPNVDAGNLTQFL